MRYIPGSFIQRLREGCPGRGERFLDRIDHGSRIGIESLYNRVGKVDGLARTGGHQHPGSVAGRLEFKEPKPRLGADLLNHTSRLGGGSDLEFIFSLAIPISAVAIKATVVVDTKIAGIDTDINGRRAAASVC